MKAICIFLAEGFEEMEAMFPLDIMRRGGLNVKTVSVTGEKTVVSSHQVPIVADMLFEDLKEEDVEMIVLPGGLGGVQSIKNCPSALEAVRALYAGGKYIAAICAAPTILAELGITDGRDATCYPGLEGKMGRAKMHACGAVTDEKVITGRAAGKAFDFGLALIEALRGEETAKRVAAEVVYGKEA